MLLVDPTVVHFPESYLMRSTRIALLAAAGLLAACGEASNEPTSPTIPPLAYVRYINAVPDTLNTTVRFIDQVEYSPMTFVNVPFRGLGQGSYQPTQAGSRKFRVFTADVANFSTAGNTVMLVDTTLTFEAGKYYTLLHSGFARAGESPRQRIVVLTDAFPALTGANIALRAVHQAFGVGPVDLYTLPSATSALSAGTRIAANFAEQAVSPYVTAPAAALAAAVAAPGGTTALVAANAPAGTPGTTAVDPIGGVTQGGSVITAIAFPASPANSAGARFAAPGIVYYIDRHPPRTTPNP
jgi:hypothetical protein